MLYEVITVGGEYIPDQIKALQIGLFIVSGPLFVQTAGPTQVVEGLGEIVLVLEYLRITSYNVCYTKLLRDVLLRVSTMASDMETSAEVNAIVITSYSIHYTKLYEDIR